VQGSLVNTHVFRSRRVNSRTASSTKSR